MKIVIVDYGMGNIKSINTTLKYIGIDEVELTSDYHKLKTADKLILPGVGSFGRAINQIRLKSIDKILEEIVLENKKPLLGICLGMQLLGKSSTEDGYNKGLGFIDGEVVKFESDNLKIPHVGFNQVKTNSSLKLYEGFNGDADFYFTHSYKMTSGSDINNCNCNYGDDFVASFEVENIAGVQFHPELSQTNGIKLLKIL